MARSGAGSRAGLPSSIASGGLLGAGVGGKKSWPQVESKMDQNLCKQDSLCLQIILVNKWTQSCIQTIRVVNFEGDWQEWEFEWRPPKSQLAKLQVQWKMMPWFVKDLWAHLPPTTFGHHAGTAFGFPTYLGPICTNCRAAASWYAPASPFRESKGTRLVFHYMYTYKPIKIDIK